MLINKLILPAAGTSLAAIVLLAAPPLWAQTSSEAKEIEELRREIAVLRAEVNSLKRQSTPHVTGEGPTKINNSPTKGFDDEEHQPHSHYAVRLARCFDGHVLRAGQGKNDQWVVWQHHTSRER